jgi:excisionase family DNA binding protein
MTQQQRENLVGDGLLRVPEARKFLGISNTLLYELMSTGKLPYIKVGTRRLIPKKALVEFAAAGLQGGSEWPPS